MKMKENEEMVGFTREELLVLKGVSKTKKMEIECMAAGIGGLADVQSLAQEEIKLWTNINKKTIKMLYMLGKIK